MILVSGLGDKATAQKQISVGMGTLAGSTVLLLTVVWGVSLVVGRVDLVTSPTCHGLVANSEIRCTGYSLTKQGEGFKIHKRLENIFKPNRLFFVSLVILFQALVCKIKCLKCIAIIKS